MAITGTGMMMPEMDEFRHGWGWGLVMGIAMILIGLIAMSMTVVTTFATVLFLGVLLLVGGAFEMVNAFRHSWHHGFWMHFFTAMLDIIVGALLLANPAVGAAALTMVIAIVLLVGGISWVVGGLLMRLPGRSLAIATGVIDFILGIMLLMSWPVSALWFLGLSVGIVLLFRGIWWTNFSLSLRKEGHHRTTTA